MARKVDLGLTEKDRIFIGEDLPLRCQLVKKDFVSDEDVIEGDLTGNTYVMEIKKNSEDPVALISVSTASEITLVAGDTSIGELTGANSVLLIQLNDTETEKILVEGLYKYDIWRTDAGLEGVAAFGDIYFKDSVRLVP